jgi:hypothetical protein
MSEFKNIRFFDGLEEVSPETAAKDKYFANAYNNGAKILFHSVIDEINVHGATLMINNPVSNPNEEKTIWLDNVSPELKQILVDKGVFK